MPRALMDRFFHIAMRIGVAGCVFAAGVLATVTAARAEGAFVTQAVGYARSGAATMAFAVPINLSNNSGIAPPTRSTLLRLLPELSPPAASGGNVASTLEIGRANQVFQAQTGANNHSSVGILNGNYNNVGVLQSGHSLVSNLLLLSTTGLSVGVIQPNGSAPVNMLIARLPNGALLIKR